MEVFPRYEPWTSGRFQWFCHLILRYNNTSAKNHLSRTIINDKFVELFMDLRIFDRKFIVDEIVMFFLVVCRFVMCFQLNLVHRFAVRGRHLTASLVKWIHRAKPSFSLSNQATTLFLSTDNRTVIVFLQIEPRISGRIHGCAAKFHATFGIYTPKITSY